MSPPLPQTNQPAVLRGFVWAAVGAVGLALIALARVPPPGPPAPFGLIAATHDRLIPGVAWSDPQDDSPHAEANLQSVSEVGTLRSTLYRLGREAVSLHRAEGEPGYPPNATSLTVGGLEVAFFEVTDLSMLAWREGDATVVLVGAPPIQVMRPAAEWFLANPQERP